MMKKPRTLRSILTDAINHLKERVRRSKEDKHQDLALAEGERRLAMREIRQMAAIRAGRNTIAWSRCAAQGNCEALRLKARKHSGKKVCRHVKKSKL